MSASPKNQYLLEIGTEELPVDFLFSASTELVDKVKAALEEQAVAYGKVTVQATPRRLALIMADLPDSQTERVFTTKGPPLRVGLDANGLPTPAGLGFARKMGVDFSQLAQAPTDDEPNGEKYLMLSQILPGRPTQEVLAEILPGLILGLSGSHFMAWGNNTIRFSRPIRWLLSLWNETHLPLCLGPVVSDTVSHGHRVLSADPIRVSSVSAYQSTLETEGAVIVDQSRRWNMIGEMLEKAAIELGGNVEKNETLLDTVTMLVEHPSVVVGRFEDRFLEIPEAVTTTVMTAHQKYFPLRGKNGNLMPYFMTVSNGRAEAADTIRLGNEKVLTARLEDARFFFTEDQKVPLQDRLEKLKGITFQKGLGSMYEKTRRLETLALQVADRMGLNPEVQSETGRAATLAKADLVTGMVFEFTELQGVMGRHYAALSGEPEAVSEAIFEHYLPRFPGDDVARSPVGIAVSLADKMDTLIAVFSQKNAKLPSGSKDPLGLRRLASGMIQTVVENKLNLDLLALMRQAYRTLLSEAPANPQFQDEQTTLTLVNDFVLQRLRGILLEQDNRYDIIDAALEAGDSALSDLQGALIRIHHLKQLTMNPDALKKIYEPANRIFKILGKHYDPTVNLKEIQTAHFRHPAEEALFVQVQKLHELGDNLAQTSKIETLLAKLFDLSEPIELFFDKVMVNDPDDTVRKNRYNLLSILNRFYLQLACFTKLVV